ncbi:GntR family transcriptional regulator [Baekduia soli]|uniref:GntR family transcriptional regulator n=1 Tax=Baekduia soli TaxID=496014 RepID=A0A5B8U007_9ACTN|nr:FCD domain-containing protein [Baekduia soli]QEC46295.1 GntR family transcriptional regulator [Baekduia soli]
MPTEPPPYDLTLAREAFTNAAALHAEATRRGAGRLVPADLDRLRAADAAFCAAVAEGRVGDAIAADDAFHQVLLDAAGDPDLLVSNELLRPRLRRMDLWLFSRKTFAPGPSSHPEIIAALEAGDAERAAVLVQRSFTEAGEALAAVLARRGTGGGGGNAGGR